MQTICHTNNNIFDKFLIVVKIICFIQGIKAYKFIFQALSLGYSPEELDTAFHANLSRWREERKSPITSLRPSTTNTSGAETILIVGSHDLVLNMLAGRYADSRIRELKPRISIDRLDNTVVAKKGALVALYLSGGTIPDRGYFHLRHHETQARIGELDEEFVWEASIGQTFSLGTQNWKIQQITHNDVFVVPGSGRPSVPPFWLGEAVCRDFHFSRRIAEFLETVRRV